MKEFHFTFFVLYPLALSNCAAHLVHELLGYVSNDSGSQKCFNMYVSHKCFGGSPGTLWSFSGSSSNTSCPRGKLGCQDGTSTHCQLSLHCRSSAILINKTMISVQSFQAHLAAIVLAALSFRNYCTITIFNLRRGESCDCLEQKFGIICNQRKQKRAKCLQFTFLPKR